jgi:hypothetical protein
MERLPLESKADLRPCGSRRRRQADPTSSNWFMAFPPLSLPPLNMKWLVHATSILALDEKIGY